MFTELDLVTIEKLSNPYLLNGYKADEFQFETLKIAPNVVIATLEVKKLFFEDIVGYHFSSVAAYISGQQLGAIYANWQNTRPGYFHVAKTSLDFHHFITEKRFQIHMEIKSRETKALTFYKAMLNFNEGKITGEGNFIYTYEKMV